MGLVTTRCGAVSEYRTANKCKWNIKAMRRATERLATLQDTDRSPQIRLFDEKYWSAAEARHRLARNAAAAFILCLSFIKDAWVQLEFRYGGAIGVGNARNDQLGAGDSWICSWTSRQTLARQAIELKQHGVLLGGEAVYVSAPDFRHQTRLLIAEANCYGHVWKVEFLFFCPNLLGEVRRRGRP
jgi:hypothetical protein